MSGIKDMLGVEEFKFLKWVEIITNENEAVKNSAMYILQKDLEFCDLIFVSDKGKKRKVGGISKQAFEKYFPLLDLSNLNEEEIKLWKEKLGGIDGKMPRHRWAGTSLAFENPNGQFDNYVNLKGNKGDQGIKGEKGNDGEKGEKGEKGESGNLSIIHFDIDDKMYLNLEIQPNTGLNFKIDENGNLIIRN